MRQIILNTKTMLAMTANTISQCTIEMLPTVFPPFLPKLHLRHLMQAVKSEP
jgi:hypothetical protein